MTPDLFDQASAARDDGIRRAVDHANRTIEDWSVRAYRFVGEYAKANHSFTTEDIRMAAARDDAVPPPPDGRAWGGIMRKAARAGMIAKCGFVTARDPKVHCNTVTLWRSRMYPGARSWACHCKVGLDAIFHHAPMNPPDGCACLGYEHWLRGDPGFAEPLPPPPEPTP